MPFSPAYQPSLSSPEILGLGFRDIKVDSSSMGLIDSVNFSVSPTFNDLVYGYPKRLQARELASITARVEASFLEFGGEGLSLLSSIASSINTGVVPTVNLELDVFKPRGSNLLIGMANVAVLQEFAFEFSNDFNSCSIAFEQLVPVGSDISDVVTFSAGSADFNSLSNQVSKGKLSLGFPKVGSLSTLSSASVKLVTEYQRLEVGYPKTLLSLTPVSHKLTVSVASEDLSSSAFEELFGVHSTAVTLQAALYDGTALTITLPEAKLIPDAVAVPEKEWASITKTFEASGSTLFTIS